MNLVILRYLVGAKSPTSNPVKIVLAHDSILNPVISKGKCVGLPQTKPLARNHNCKYEGQTGQNVACDREASARVGLEHRIDHSSRSAD